MNLRLFLGVFALVGILFVGPNSNAQGTAFSYQGHLMNNGLPANGNYDLTFALFPYSEYGFPAGPVLTNLDTPVTGGLFYTTLDFGSVFSGSNYWLEIGVRTNGNGNFTTLEPRQFITPVPYAIYAANASNAVTASSVPAGGIIGTIPIFFPEVEWRVGKNCIDNAVFDPRKNGHAVIGVKRTETGGICRVNPGSSFEERTRIKR